MPWWDARAAEVAALYPDVTWDKQHIDILCARFVLNPDRFDVVVATNLFGDILSDLGPACTGTIGIAPSGNLNPDRNVPVAVRAGARLGAGHRRQEHRQSDRDDLVGGDDARLPRRRPGRGTRAHDAMLAAIEAVLKKKPHTGDLGGKANTTEVGKAIAERLA